MRILSKQFRFHCFVIPYDVSTFVLPKIIDMLEKLIEKKPSVMALNSDNNTNAVSAGIDTATITKLPSGVVGREENINGETLFSVEEGKAKVYFPRSTTEEVFYNPGKEMFPTLSESITKLWIMVIEIRKTLFL